MKLRRAIGSQAGVNRLVPAFHARKDDADVDEKIGGHRPAVQFDDLVAIGLSKELISVAVLGVVAIESVRIAEIKDPRPKQAPQLLGRHPAMEAGRGNQVDVRDSFLGELLEQQFDDDLPGVGLGYRRDRHREVIEGDREFHVRPQLRGQGVASERILNRLVDCGP